jgi:3-phenylpropionate/cinnamic acid dioxygenase small subunit
MLVPTTAGDIALYLDVQHFLFEEASLLDEHRYEAWLALCAPDIRYWMPAQFVRQRRDRAHTIGDEHDLPMFEETWEHLHQRVKRIATGQAWAEEPPSRTRRLVTNLRIERDGDDVRAFTNLLLYRTRHESDVQFFVASRSDVLRRDGAGWKIAKRTIVLDATTVPGHNLSVLF